MWIHDVLFCRDFVLTSLYCDVPQTQKLWKHIHNTECADQLKCVWITWLTATGESLDHSSTHQAHMTQLIAKKFDVVVSSVHDCRWWKLFNTNHAHLETWRKLPVSGRRLFYVSAVLCCVTTHHDTWPGFSVCVCSVFKQGARKFGNEDVTRGAQAHLHHYKRIYIVTSLQAHPHNYKD